MIAGLPCVVVGRRFGTSMPVSHQDYQSVKAVSSLLDSAPGEHCRRVLIVVIVVTVVAAWAKLGRQRWATVSKDGQ